MLISYLHHDTQCISNEHLDNGLLGSIFSFSCARDVDRPSGLVSRVRKFAVVRIILANLLDPLIVTL